MRGERILLLVSLGLSFVISSELHAGEAAGPGLVPAPFAQPFRGQCSAEFSYEVTFTAATAGEALASVTIVPGMNVEEPGLIIDFFCTTPLAAGEVVTIPVNGILTNPSQEGLVTVNVLACDPDGDLQENMAIETRILPCDFLCPPNFASCPQGLPVLGHSVPTLSGTGLLILLILLSITAAILLR